MLLDRFRNYDWERGLTDKTYVSLTSSQYLPSELIVFLWIRYCQVVIQ